MTCPTRMAKLLKETWEPIWEGRQIPDSLMDGYLASYTKRLQGIRPVALADVIRVIADPKKTCAGPNGIPFAAYAAVCATVAPICLELSGRCARDGPRSKGMVTSTCLICIFSRKMIACCPTIPDP